MAALVDAVRRSSVEPGMPIPGILIVAPPAIQKPKGSIAPKFEGAKEKSVGLAAALQRIARECGCEFFDAGSVTRSSLIDGVHLDADQHLVLGRALAQAVAPLLPASGQV